MDPNPDGTLSREDASAFGRELVAFIDQARSALPRADSPVTAAIRAHIPGEISDAHTVARQFDRSEHVNVQLAIEHLFADGETQVLGLDRQTMHYGGFSLPGIATGSFHGPLVPGPVDYVSLPSGPDSRVDCMRIGIVLGHHARTPVAVLVVHGEEHGPEAGLRVEVMAPDEEATGSCLDALTAEMRNVNVFRGQTMAFSFSEYGSFGLEFVEVPELGRSEVILPDATLDAIDQHAIGISLHADSLLVAGQHLKRGLLLYGPPGTGKTHTVMYLANHLQDRTTFILAGPAVGAVGQAGALARTLAPATIVIEDVDLIASERGAYGVETNPLLFQLLNEMDGMAPDADVLFVLTTNRIDALEGALAARPGRIDQALEIGLPDAEARSRLLDLYLDVPIGEEVRAAAVEQTDGVAAAFIKELARRATLRAAEHATTPAEQLLGALDDMLEQSTPVLRASLGMAPADGDELRPSFELGPLDVDEY